MARVQKDSMMGRLRTMEIGEEQVFPVEKAQYIFATCSLFKRTIKKTYTTTLGEETVTVRRVA